KMQETYLLDHPGVIKKILHGGQGPLPHFPKGTNVRCIYGPGKRFLLDVCKDGTVIDDSHKNKHPTEIVVDKMFKMEVWEVLLTSMRIGEVAEFWCDAIVSRAKNTCGMGNLFHYHSTGFPELDELMRTPPPLIFIMELISVGDPFSYQRESWMMEKDEKLKVVPSLHILGNALVKQGQFCEAAEKYQEAVVLLRTVQSKVKEKQNDMEVIRGLLIIPLVLNYCQCMLELEEYYEVIEHTTELLDKHKDNLKAVYQWARAHSALCKEDEAHRDFNRVLQLDPKFKPIIQQEIKKMGENIRVKCVNENKNYWASTQENRKQPVT
uniref:Aryl hydrocarbon receptor interacting protein like 2 n=1 Tax=Sinocyclocheilus anshuiensis TaxID=1608454 RepID=A0A671SLI7_9TELE